MGSRASEAAAELLAVMPTLGRVVETQLQKLEEPISLMRFRVLAYLAREPARNADLARAFDVAAPTISGVVDGLVHQGWIERHPDPGDRRAVVLKLTPRGGQELKRLELVLQDAVLAVLEGVDEVALQSLTRGLKGLRDALLAAPAAAETRRS